jgi:Amt family ammonium transporter
MAFQATFCIITAALISGAIVERMRFSAYVVFITLWSIVVYAPLAHWVWGGGFLADMGAWDFAGGTVVHVNAASARWSRRIVLGKRRAIRRRRSCRTACRWCCWAPGCLCGSAGSGFNAGQRPGGQPDCRPGVREPRCWRRPARWWCGRCLDWFRLGQVHRVGAATAIVVGLVAITPAAGLHQPDERALSGAIAAFRATSRLIIRAKTSLDDSLDVVAAHGVGGTVGALLTGVFAEKSLNGVFDG